MHPAKVTRDNLSKLTDLPNIGTAGESDLLVLGIATVDGLIGRCPYKMHAELCVKTGFAHDVCVIDVFISITRFMQGDKAKPWWEYTQERKRHLNET